MYERANRSLRDSESKEERVMLLDAWLNMEKKAENNDAQVQKVEKLIPKRVKKRRKVQTEDGVSIFNFYIVFNKSGYL